MTKSQRHEKILELITKENISTQTDLTNKLIEVGFDVTQATTSRDLQELRIIKIMLSDGTYKYTVNRGGEDNITQKLHKVLGECLLRAESAQNIIVLKTMTGAAQAVAYALESFIKDEIVGSIAGDDTVMMVAHTEQGAKDVADKLQKFIQ